MLEPDWRYQRVRRLVSRQPTPGRVTRQDDQYVKEARSYMLARRRYEDDEIAADWPDMHVAFSVYEKMAIHPEVSHVLEARLLAGMSHDRIAESLNMFEGAVTRYAALFFDVQPRLKQRDWIYKHVLIPATKRHAAATIVEENEDDENTFSRAEPVVEPHFDSTLKFFAYFGGEVALDFMITGFRQDVRITSPDELGEFLDNVFMLQVQKRSAQAVGKFEVNKYNVLELLGLHARVIELQQAPDQDENKKSTVDRHIQAFMEDLPWVAGKEARQGYGQTVLGRYDESAAELGSDEMMLLASGEIADPEGVLTAEFPAPPLRIEQKDEAKDGIADLP